MTTDPFDRLREANPVPDERLPGAPMSVAERILNKRTASAPMPGWAIAATAAVLVAVLGSAWLLLVDNDQSEPFASSAPTSIVPDTTLPIEQPAEPTPPPTTEPAPATTAPETTVPWTVGYDGEFPIYLFLDDNGTENAPGPYLIPTMRTTAILSAPVTNIYATVAAFLVNGPTPGEIDAVPAMSSAIPEGTRVLDVAVSEGLATIDLSSGFVAGGTDPRSFDASLAQAVFTLTAFDEIDRVLFTVEGVAPTVLTPEGPASDPGWTRDAFAEYLPAIMIESPPHWGRAGNPLVASGNANVFEATVSLALTDGDGLILWEGFTTATCGTGCRGDWTIEIPYTVDEAQMGALIAWEESARDGSQTNVREHPVWLEPTDSATATTVTTIAPDGSTADPDTMLWQRIQSLRAEAWDLEKERKNVAEQVVLATDPDARRELEARLADVEQIIFGAIRPQLVEAVDEARAAGWAWDLILNETCSGTMADPSLPDQGLEDNRPVIETWDDLHHAAVTCDWELLADYVGDGSGMNVTFGEPTHPLELWQYEEAIGYQPMYYLAEILRRPHTVSDPLPFEGSRSYVWPSAFIGEWDQVPEADRQALKPLYTEADLQAFAEFGGYFGYRLGIHGDTGEWLFFLQGD